MSQTGRVRLDYGTCRYGASRLQFRGPERPLNTRYVAFLGGSEVFGKFVPMPVSDCVEEALDVPCINLGQMNAGVDAFLKDVGALDVAARAAVTVVQITGAQNNSNRFYTVHPRANDRFVTGSDALRVLYPDTDFADVHYTRHALGELAADEDRFEAVVAELKTAWSARMAQLLEMIPGEKVLFWMARRSIAPQGRATADDPLFIDAEMVANLAPFVSQTVAYAESDAAKRDGTNGMIFDPVEARAARHLMGPRAHREAAETLVPVLRDMLGGVATVAA